MSNEIKYKGKELHLKNKILTFEYDVRNVGVLSDRVVVLLGIPENVDNITDNIYSFSLEGDFLWKSQNISEKYPNLENLLPYEQMSYYSGKIHASDFLGRNFAINPTDGKIVDFSISK